MVSIKSLRTVQHIQPLASSIFSSALTTTKSASNHIAPNSLMTRATFLSLSLSNKRLRIVVLPAHKNHDIIVTGVLDIYYNKILVK